MLLDRYLATAATNTNTVAARTIPTNSTSSSTTDKGGFQQEYPYEGEFYEYQ